MPGCPGHYAYGLRVLMLFTLTIFCRFLINQNAKTTDYLGRIFFFYPKRFIITAVQKNSDLLVPKSLFLKIITSVSNCITSW